MPSKLQAARRERKWSQPRLIAELERHARANGVTVASRTSLKSLISRWENGHAVPDESHRRLLRQIYGRTDAELGIEPPPATASRMPAITSVEAWELTDALTRHTISSATLAQLKQAVFDCAERYPASTPTQLLPVVQHQLARLRNVLEYPQSVDARRRTVRLCSVLAGLAGNLSLDSSDERRAHAYFDAAAIAAAEAEDADLSAWVLATRSIVPFYGDRPAEALAMLEQAAALAERRSSPRRRSWVITLKARAHSAAGEPTAAADSLDRARALMSTVTEAGRGTDFFDAARLDGLAGSCASLLGKHAEAAELLIGAIGRRAARDRKGRALLALDLAACRLDQGEIEEACRLTSDALRNAHGTLVAPIRTRARAVRRRMQPWERIHAVVALDDDLAAAAS